MATLGSLANQIRQKTGALTRCCKEYETYLQELEVDKKRLADLTARGEGTTQAANVVKETEGMIPIVRKNALKMADSFIDFWEDNRSALEASVGAEGADVVKFRNECGQSSRRLKKLIEVEEAPSSPLEPAVLAMIRAVQSDLELLAEDKPLSS